MSRRRPQRVVMPFGMHKGLYLDELPESYFRWVAGLELRSPLKEAVEAERVRRLSGGWYDDDLGDEPETGSRAIPIRAALQPLALQIVKQGFRAVAREVHPDHGGNHEETVLLIEAREVLDRLVRGAA